MFKPLVYKFGYRELYHRGSISTYLSMIKSKKRSNLKKIPEFPLAIHIETTSYCDNKCIFCTRQERGRESEHMSEELFRKIIDECAEHKKTNLINLFKDGDPILHPKLPEFIKYAKEKKAAKTICIATGGGALNPDLSKEIILSGLDEIFFSVDALTEEQYKEIKGVDNYGRVLKNIFDFVKTREKLKSRTPKIIVKMLATDIVQDDIELFVRLWINVADWVLIDREVNIWDGTNNRVNELMLNMKNYDYKKSEIRYPCNRPWYMASIYADGKVTVCPEDWDQKMIIGDMKNDSLFNIWNGEELNLIKKCHIDGAWEQLPACQSCDAHIIKNMGNWFRENKEKALRRKVK